MVPSKREKEAGVRSAVAVVGLDHQTREEFLILK